MHVLTASDIRNWKYLGPLFGCTNLWGFVDLQRSQGAKDAITFTFTLIPGLKKRYPAESTAVEELNCKKGILEINNHNLESIADRRCWSLNTIMSDSPKLIHNCREFQQKKRSDIWIDLFRYLLDIIWTIDDERISIQRKHWAPGCVWIQLESLF